MLFNIIILFMVASIAWVLWTERKSKQALDKDALDQAWRKCPMTRIILSGGTMKNVCV